MMTSSSLRRFLLLVAILSLVVLPSVSIAGSWYVSATADPGGDGLAWGTAFQTIQAGIDASTNGDEIWIADGIYIGDGNRDISFDGKAITVQSLNGPESCIIDCQGTEEEPHRGFSFVSGETLDSVLKGVTIRNGYGPEEDPYDDGTSISSGGAIYIYNSSPRIEQCVLENSYAHNGGGVYGYGCGSEFLNCVIRKNQANSAGGMYFGRATSRFLSCTIQHNYAHYCGACWFSRSSSLFTYCRFYANTSSIDERSQREILQSLGSLVLENCVLVGCRHSNTSLWHRGSIIRLNYADFNCRNTTIWNDQIGYVCDVVSGIGESQVTNTIMAGKRTLQQQLSDIPEDTIQHSIIQGLRSALFPESTNSLETPLFVRNPSHGGDGWGDDPLTPDVDESLNDDFGDLRLCYGSPGIDAGVNDLVPQDQWDIDGDGDFHEPVPYDIASNPRFYDAPGIEGDVQPTSIVDIGAYEYTEDCNQNGIPDELDVQSGYSMDCNSNSIPDECEPDCNTNGQMDACDISDGLSSDDNSDGIPDECQPIIYVAPDAPDGGDGQSWQTAFNTIQAAVDAAQENDEILLADGVYTGDGNRDVEINGEIPLIVQSCHGPENCVIDCQGTEEDPHRGFLLENPHLLYDSQMCVIEGVSVINGYAPEDEVSGGYRGIGGAIASAYTVPVISNCVFRNNSAWCGGAIGLVHAHSIVIDCDLSDNYGGAVCQDNGFSRFYSCRIMNNKASAGGGIYLYTGESSYESCLIAGNKAESGGGVYVVLVNDDYADFVNCVFLSNRGYGGAIYFEDCLEYSYVNLTNCSLVNNYSLYGSSTAIQSSYNFLWSNLNIRNSIIRNPDRPGDVIKFQYPYYDGEINISHSNIQGGWEGDFNIDVDPQWAFLENPVLMPGSPCIDTGSNGPGIELPERDIEGNPRIQNNQVDMGAYEFDPGRSIKLVSQQQTIRLIAYGGTDPVHDTIQFRNAGVAQVSWNADIVFLDGAPDADWLQLSSSQGTCAGEVQSIELTADPENLEPGSYHARVQVEVVGEADDTIAVDFEFIVGRIIEVHADGSGEYPTIQAGIDAANPGDVILCSNGVYTGDGNRDISFLGKEITVRSQNGPELTIVDCEGTDSEPKRGFLFNNDEGRNSILDGFTITNGNGDFLPSSHDIPSGKMGGGILCLSSSPCVRNCHFINNHTPHYGPTYGAGGGLLAYKSELLLEKCYFIGNASGMYGGGIYSLTSNLDCQQCIFEENLADNGGGFCAVDSMLNFDQCIFKQNSARQGGGGFMDGNVLAMTECTLLENQADQYGGGGVYSYSGRVELNDCQFWANSGGYGGAISASRTRLFCSNLTLCNNHTDTSGSAVWKQYSYIWMDNSIIWGNTSDSGESPIFNSDTSDDEYSLVIRSSCIQDGWDGEGDSNIDADPLLADIARGNLRLRAGSPCIDAGNNDRSASETDLAGLLRFYDDPYTPDTGIGTPPIVDMGAFEYQPHEGDYDADGDVDLADFAWFQTCLGSTEHNCQAAFDFDDDTDITLADYAQLADHLTGPR